MSVHVRMKRGGLKSYQVKWRDEWGNQFSRIFRLKGDADELDRRIKDGFDPNAEIANEPQRELTFAEFSERWTKDYCEVHQSYGTIKVSRNRIKLYFEPLFGNMLLSAIRPVDVARLQQRCLVELKLLPSTVNQVVAQFRKMMDDACTWDLIQEDPSRKVRPLKVQRKEFQFWTIVERDRFLAYCKTRDPDLYTGVAIAVNTGLRRGELQGLLRDCVDFERQEILVKRGFCSASRKIEERTKSQRSRRVELNKVALAALAPRMLVAPNEPMITFGIANLMDKRFPEMCDAAGVSRIRWHDLRHTFASHLAMAGKPIRVIQELLGHQSVTMTERYAHLCPGFSRGVTAALDVSEPCRNVPKMFPKSVQA